MNNFKCLLVLPALLLASGVVGALGGNTAHYQCKYVDRINTQVKDKGAHDTALYAIYYTDGTVGATSDMDNYGPAGVQTGTACKTVFNFGWPYQWTNHKVGDQSQVKP